MRTGTATGKNFGTKTKFILIEPSHEFVNYLRSEFNVDAKLFDEHIEIYPFRTRYGYLIKIEYEKIKCFNFILFNDSPNSIDVLDEEDFETIYNYDNEYIIERKEEPVFSNFQLQLIALGITIGLCFLFYRYL